MWMRRTLDLRRAAILKSRKWGVLDHFDLLADQRIDAEPEHELGFEL